MENKNRIRAWRAPTLRQRQHPFCSADPVAFQRRDIRTIELDLVSLLARH